MARRAGLRGTALALIAGAMAVSPGSARLADPPAAESPAAEPQVVGRAGLICVWAIHATMLEVGRRCGGPRNAAFEAELERSVARIEDYAGRGSPDRAAAMAEYRARQVLGDAQLCHPDTLEMYEHMSRATPEAVRGETDRLLASSPPVAWGACL